MGLRAGDLKNCVYKVFEIDSYKSKMGDDKNIVTLSFSVNQELPAKDLMNFLETGYEFVLDADTTAGEQSDGTYKVFVELQRSKNVGNEILEIVDGVKKISELDDLKFRYYKNFRSMDTTEQSLKEYVPTDPENYGIKVEESHLENYKNFFNKSYLDSIDVLEDELTISKKWSEPLKFDIITSGQKEEILENLKDKINVNDFAEVIFLSKYIGDYNITKFGDKFMLENKDTAVLVKRKNV
jgi:hypothetical protein